MSLYATGIVRIITDPQLRAFESGTMVANFAGGIQEGKDKDGNWINNAIDCEIWGKSAELIVDKQWTFTLELLQDWGAAGSLFEIFWGVAESAPNTGISVVFTAASGATFTFQVLPIFPSAGGAAPGALTDTWTLTVIGQPAESYT